MLPGPGLGQWYEAEAKQGAIVGWRKERISAAYAFAVQHDAQTRCKCIVGMRRDWRRRASDAKHAIHLCAPVHPCTPVCNTMLCYAMLNDRRSYTKRRDVRVRGCSGKGVT